MNMNEWEASSPAASPEVFQRLGAITRQLHVIDNEAAQRCVHAISTGWGGSCSRTSKPPPLRPAARIPAVPR